MASLDALEQLAEPVPLNIRNAVTKLMKELDPIAKAVNKILL